MQNSICGRPLLLSISLGAMLLLTQPVEAARLLDVTIEQDGRVIAHTYYQDNGRADAATVWRYLASAPIMVDEDIDAVESDPAVLEVNLTGELVIRFEHVDRVIAEARLSALTLKRTNPNSQEWFLSDSEVERTARAAGLGAPARMPSVPAISFVGLAVVAIAAVGLFGLIAAVVVVVLYRGPRRVPS